MKATPLGESIGGDVVIGEKARHVRWLLTHGARVPETYVIPADGTSEPSVAAWLPDAGPWAVRSSATVEDGVESSYAGQFATFLDVVGAAAVDDAVRDVLASVEGRASAYRSRVGDATPIRMAVMVQRMVNPVVSGVAFSRNPLTGLNEVVIEAVEGRGDALVEAGVTPDRWIYRWGEWSASPAESTALPDEVAKAVAEGSVGLAERFGSPVDLEWVWDGQEVWWVQLRPITGVRDLGIYSNRMSREFLPGMIKPLVWSVNVPMVNRAWIGLLESLVGHSGLEPEMLARPFAYRAYFNMATIGRIFELVGLPRDSLEALLGLPVDAKPSFRPSLATARHLPRVAGFAARLARYDRVVRSQLEALERDFRAYHRDDIDSLSDSDLVGRIDALITVCTKAAEVNILTPVLANLYVGALRSRLRKAGVDADQVDLDLGVADHPANPRNGLAALRDAAAEAGFSADDLASGVTIPARLQSELDDFLDRFGHFSVNGNDFSVPRWRDEPATVLRMAVDHAELVGGGDAQPLERALESTGRLRRRTARFLQVRARRFSDHRETVSSLYTFGYGLFRPYFLELGRRLEERGILAEAEDVMYLQASEARSALMDGDHSGPLGDLAIERRAEMADLADVEMPETIFGEDFVPVRKAKGTVTQLQGVPTSRGRHRGILRVVSGQHDFSRVDPGDVIAIPYSDVAWTPLFARAGAVVAAAGGLLSHSSIVAREYRIPCVVSVTGAMDLPDGARVVVDGYTGVVVVE